MNEFRGRASAEVDVPVKDCFELLAAVERYPTWFDAVSEVEVLEQERNGTPGLARAELRAAASNSNSSRVDPRRSCPGSSG